MGTFTHFTPVQFVGSIPVAENKNEDRKYQLLKGRHETSDFLKNDSELRMWESSIK